MSFERVNGGGAAAQGSSRRAAHAAHDRDQRGCANATSIGSINHQPCNDSDAAGMSYARPRPNGTANGTASYTNGSASTNAQRLARFDFDTTPDTSADERSRSRPAPTTAFSHNANPHTHAPAQLARQAANRRSLGGGGYDGTSSPSRSRSRPAGNAPSTSHRYGARGTEVEELLSYIAQHWPFMASSSCVPIKIALQLNDPSSLGLADQYGQFREVHQQLQNALKVIVNEHHQGFNSSIGTFHQIQSAIHASQHRVRALRAGIVQAKSSLSTARPDLRAYATSSQSYDSMLRVVADIETLQQLPDRLDAEISEKRFLSAVGTLQEGLALLRQPAMEDLGALAELRRRLGNQEHFLADHLVEELHNHLYLKSPYCEARWKARAEQQQQDPATSSDSSLAFPEDDSALSTFLDSHPSRDPMHEDPTRNPEADSFAYIQLLTESLARLGRLDAAGDEIERRLPVELFTVVERSHGAVARRHPASAQGRSLGGGMAIGLTGVRTPQESLETERTAATLRDLLATLYAQFESIAEAHRALHAVTAAILQREGPGIGGGGAEEARKRNRGFRELWGLLQSEMRSLLHDHLTVAGAAGLGGSGRGEKGGDVNGGMFRPQGRDRGKRLFRVGASGGEASASDTAAGASRANGADPLATETEDLLNMLRDSVPGLVHHPLRASLTLSKPASSSSHHPHPASETTSATGHKLLVPPNLFNMSLLLPPSLDLLHRLRTLIPPGSGIPTSSATTFLDDFLLNVFLPQLDDTLTELCARATGGTEAFEVYPAWRAIGAGKPVFRGVVEFWAVLERVCGMLGALPHEVGFAQCVVGGMRGVYERCYSWSRGLLVKSGGGGEGGAGMKRAAELATGGEVGEVVISLLGLEKDRETGGGQEGEVLAEKEAALLIKDVRAKEVQEADLIADRKALAQLCTLQVSMKWLEAKCRTLRYISPRAVDLSASSGHSPDPATKERKHHNHHVRRWTSASRPGNSGSGDEPTPPYLPMDAPTATQFDAVLASFTELSTLVLRTLHLDLRLQLLHGVARTLHRPGGTYALGQAYNDPDPAVLELSSSLATYEGVIRGGLLPAQCAFLTRGLHVLGSNALVGLLESVPAMDGYGLARMQLNVLVLQQAVKNLEGEGSLGRAAQFFGLGELGCEAIVREGRQAGFGKEELAGLVRLCWEEERDERGGADVYLGMLNGLKGAMKRAEHDQRSQRDLHTGGSAPPSSLPAGMLWRWRVLPPPFTVCAPAKTWLYVSPRDAYLSGLPANRVALQRKQTGRRAQYACLGLAMYRIVGKVHEDAGICLESSGIGRLWRF
ncbi:exocyst subunit [Teratosphaeriaceae sp. CCFEE 6253]|nr:exocyst subunit [Teratosphaeriaceae sp. CCFEE 6253]